MSFVLLCGSIFEFLLLGLTSFVKASSSFILERMRLIIVHLSFSCAFSSCCFLPVVFANICWMQDSSSLVFASILWSWDSLFAFLLARHSHVLATISWARDSLSNFSFVRCSCVLPLIFQICTILSCFPPPLMFTLGRFRVCRIASLALLIFSAIHQI